MEFLELLIASAEGCGCFLEVAAALFDLGAGVGTYKVGKKVKERREAIAHGEEPPRKPAVWPLVLVILGAVFLTGLVLFKWVQRLG